MKPINALAARTVTNANADAARPKFFPTKNDPTLGPSSLNGSSCAAPWYAAVVSAIPRASGPYHYSQRAVRAQGEAGQLRKRTTGREDQRTEYDWDYALAGPERAGVPAEDRVPEYSLHSEWSGDETARNAKKRDKEYPR